MIRFLLLHILKEEANSLTKSNLEKVFLLVIHTLFSKRKNNANENSHVYFQQTVFICSASYDNSVVVSFRFILQHRV